MPSPRRAAASFAVGVLLAGQLIGPAEAHHGGRPIGSFSDCRRPNGVVRCTSVGDNTVHHVFFDATLTDELAAALTRTMEEDYEPTKLTMIVDRELTDTTDVIAFSEDYGENGAAGWVACPLDSPQGVSPLGHRWCRGQELFFNLNPRYAIYLNDDGSRDYVACHELGHTLGLRHWGNPPDSAGPAAATCMNADTPDGPTDLHQIDIDHINDYPYQSQPRLRLPSFPLLSVGSLGAVQPLEVERAGSLPEMVGSADAVVVGQVTAVTAGRTFGGRTGHPLHYASVAVMQTSAVSGHAPERLTLEVPLFDGPASLGELRAAIGMEAIWFLRAKADGPYWRLTHFGAVVANEDGVATTADAPRALSQLDGLAFDAAVRQVRGD